MLAFMCAFKSFLIILKSDREALVCASVPESAFMHASINRSWHRTKFDVVLPPTL